MNELTEKQKKEVVKLMVMVGLAMIGVKVQPVAKKSKLKAISNAKFITEKFKNKFKL